MMGIPPEQQFLDSRELQQITGTKASTWRYWASKGVGPPSFHLGKRRVWERDGVEQWLADQKNATDKDSGPGGPGQ